MNKYKGYHLPLLILPILLTACVSTKQLDAVVVKKKSKKFLIKKLEKHKITFNWVGIKSKLKIASEKQKLSASANIRIKKDSLIWVKISKLGIEGVRIKITPTLVEILDHQNSKYIRRPYAMLQEEYGVDITFADLQDLLMGNPIWYKEKNLLAAIEEKRNVLRSPKSEKDILKIFFESSTFMLSELRGSVSNNSMSILYDDYQKVDKQILPFRKTIEIDSPEKGIATLKIIFTKVVLEEPQKVRFTVPDSYNTD